MNTYQASYRETWNYGGFQDNEYIVIANTEAEALGLALESESGSKKENWEITEIDTTRAHATETYDRSC